MAPKTHNNVVFSTKDDSKSAPIVGKIIDRQEDKTLAYSPNDERVYVVDEIVEYLNEEESEASTETSPDDVIMALSNKLEDAKDQHIRDLRKQIRSEKMDKIREKSVDRENVSKRDVSPEKFYEDNSNQTEDDSEEALDELTEDGESESEEQDSDTQSSEESSINITDVEAEESTGENSEGQSPVDGDVFRPRLVEFEDGKIPTNQIESLPKIECPVCLNDFSKYSISNHTKAEHGFAVNDLYLENQGLDCTVCGNEYSDTSSVSSHMGEKHGFGLTSFALSYFRDEIKEIVKDESEDDIELETEPDEEEKEDSEEESLEEDEIDESTVQITDERAFKDNVFRPRFLEMETEGLVSDSKLQAVESIECPVCLDNQSKFHIGRHLNKEHGFKPTEQYKKIEDNKCIFCGKKIDQLENFSSHYNSEHGTSFSIAIIARLKDKILERANTQQNKEEREEGNILSETDISPDIIDFDGFKEVLLDFFDQAERSYSSKQILEIAGEDPQNGILQNRVWRSWDSCDEIESFKKSRKRYYYTGDRKPQALETEFTPKENKEEEEDDEEFFEQESPEDYEPDKEHLDKELKLNGDNPLDNLHIIEDDFSTVKLKIAEFLHLANRMASVEEMLKYSGIDFDSSKDNHYNKFLRACKGSEHIKSWKNGRRMYFYTQFESLESVEMEMIRQELEEEIGVREYEIRRAILGKLMPEKGKIKEIKATDIDAEYGGADGDYNYIDFWRMLCQNQKFQQLATFDLEVEADFRLEKMAQSVNPEISYKLFIDRKE